MMKELSMHILDIASNSVRGQAENIIIKVIENVELNIFSFEITDDGVGIPNEIFKTIKNPFTTSRTMRKVGLGIPLLDDTCRVCKGELVIETIVGKGTKLVATMELNNIDRPPLGDMVSTIVGLMTSYEMINIQYIHQYNNKEFEVSTNDIKESLGDVSLTEIEVFSWLKGFFKENIDEIRK